MKRLSLIQTKLTPPRSVSDFLRRPRLIAKLERGRDRKLILVVAPAGYGKSSLVADYLEEGDRPFAWYALDENDGNIRTFLHYFVAAIQKIFPEIGHETLSLLQAPDWPPLRVLVGTFINELNQISEPFTVVLDDYHLIHDVVIHDFMDELIRHAPEPLHLIVISRLEPPFHLLQLRARAQMAEIRTEDLRFTQEEIAAFVRKSRGVIMEEDDVVLMQEKTEGWAAGIRLCMLSLQNADDFRHLVKRLPEKGPVIDYLFQEVFAKQYPIVQDYLLRTSILERFNASLVNAVVGCDIQCDEGMMDGERFLSWLEGADVFVTPMDHNEKWFRYHHLFQALLRYQLGKRYQQSKIAELHVRASDWFARHGYVEEALQHAKAAGDFERIAQLFGQHRHEILDQDRWPLLGQWLSLFSEEEISRHPELLLTRLWVAHFRYELTLAPRLLRQLDELLVDTEKTSTGILAEQALFHGILQFWRGDLNQTVAYCEKALSFRQSEDTFCSSEAEVFLGIAYQMTGQGHRTLERYQQLVNAEQMSPGRKGRLLGTLVFVYILSGDLLKAYRLTRRLFNLIQQTDNRFLLGWSHYLLGYIHLLWAEFEAAAMHFTRLIELRYLMDYMTPIESYVGLMLARQASGDEQGARDVLEQLLVYADESGDPRRQFLSRSAQAHLMALQRDQGGLLRLRRTLDFSQDHGVLFLWMETPRITHAKLLIGLNSKATLIQATQLLHEYLQDIRRSHNVRQEMDVLPWLALANLRLGKPRAAKEALLKALTLAEPSSWIYPFLEPGVEILELLQEVKKEGRFQEVVDLILQTAPSAVPPTNHPSISPQPLYELLTDRELEVLALMARRYSNKEIAEELVISTATVKRHASNIYQKLQANGRREAVTKAFEMGLITIPEWGMHTESEKKPKGV